MTLLRMTDLDLAGKRVLIRQDLNVPIDEHGRITSEQRILASLPTLRLALDKGDVEGAKAAQAAFDKGHPMSSKILGAMVLLTLINMVLTAASVGRNSKTKVM